MNISSKERQIAQKIWAPFERSEARVALNYRQKISAISQCCFYFLQALFTGNLLKTKRHYRHIAQEKTSTIKIQQAWKRTRLKKRLKQQITEKRSLATQKNAAATRIQAMWRMRLQKPTLGRLREEAQNRLEEEQREQVERKRQDNIQQEINRYHTLAVPGKEEAAQLISHAKCFSNEREKKVVLPLSLQSHQVHVQRAGYGNAAVYLFHKVHRDQGQERREAYPFVLKKVAHTRLQQLASAHAICHTHNLKGLHVPQATQLGHFIVEERVDFPRSHPAYWDLYCNHLQAFDQAATDFATFMCETELGDVIGGIGEDANLFGGASPKFDNFPIYIKDGIGQLALVDLDQFEPRPVFPTEQKKIGHYHTACRAALHFFPHHFDRIIDVLKKYHPSVEKKEVERLRSIKDHVLKGFSKIYTSHDTVLTNHQANHHTFPSRFSWPSPFPYPDSDIQTLVRVRLKNLQFGGVSVSPQQFLSESLSEHFPQLVAGVGGFLQEQIEKQVAAWGPIQSKGELMSARRFCIDLTHWGEQENIYFPLREKIISYLPSEWKTTFISESERKALGMPLYGPPLPLSDYIAGKLLNCILKEASDNEVVSFHNDVNKRFYVMC